MQNLFSSVLKPTIAQFAGQEPQQQDQQNEAPMPTQEDMADPEEYQMAMMRRRGAMEFRSINEELKRFTFFGPSKINGFRFSVNQPLTSRFILGSEWKLIPKSQGGQPGMGMMQGGAKGSQYTLKTTYVIPNWENQMLSTNFQGEYSSNGNLTAMMHQPLSSWASMLVQMVFPSSPQIPRQQHLIFQAHNKTQFWNFHLSNIENSVSFVNLIGRNAQVGCNFVYVPMQGMSGLSFAGRYQMGKKAFLANYDQVNKSFEMGMTYKIDKKTQIMTSFNKEPSMNARMLGPMAGPMETTTKATFGYKKIMLGSVIRGVIDSEFDLKAALKMTTVDQMLSFSFYGEGNLTKDNFKFGYGIDFGQG